MKKCKKNILLIFGYLLFVAILIVPYSSFTIEKNRLKDGFSQFGDYFNSTNYEKVVIRHRKSGWVFSPYMLISKRHFFINWNTLAVEIAVILITAGFSYIIFCIVLKKEVRKA